MFEIVIDVREHALIEKIKDIAANTPTSPIKIETSALLLGDILFRITPFSIKDAKSVAHSSLITVPEGGVLCNEERCNTTTEIILFERKSFTDLLASIKDGRYDEQSHRLIHTSGMHPHNIIYVIEGSFLTLRNPADKKIIMSAMTSLSYFKGFSVFRTATVMETAELIWSMANKLQKEFEKGKPIPSYTNARTQINANTDEVDSENMERSEPTTVPISYGNFVKKSKRENITPENIGEILLSQIPGISNHIAKEILKHFDGSFVKLIEDIKTNPEKLNAIYLESVAGNGTMKRRKLSSTVIQSILEYLVQQ